MKNIITLLLLCSCSTNFATLTIGEREQLEKYNAKITKSYNGEDVQVEIKNIRRAWLHQRNGVLTQVVVEYWGEAFIGSAYVDSTGIVIQERSAAGYKDKDGN